MATTADTVSVTLKEIMVLTKTADTRLVVVLKRPIGNHQIIVILYPNF